MQKDIEKTWVFNQPAAIVWDYLTKPELIAQWLMDNNFEPVVGHKFRFLVNKEDNCHNDGAMCEVLEVVPCERLCYSWKTGPAGGELIVDTLVEWTLMQQDNGTQLQLKHSGFTDMVEFESHNEGWAELVQGFMNILNTQPV